MHFIDLPPEPLSMMESTRAIGYSTQTAVADILDNSIAAGAKNIDILYLPNDEESYIAILDDGCGMNADEINVAMQYGGKSPLEDRSDTDLGRFGLGMKTASLSQCECLTVISKQGDQVEGRCWDLDYIKKQEKWALLVLDEAEIQKTPEIEVLMQKEHGTLVVWQNLARMRQGDDARHSINTKMDAVREHLSLVFHRYLSGEKGLPKVRIAMNGREIEPSDPMLKKRSKIPLQPFTIHKTDIKVTPYQLPFVSNLKKKDYDTLGITRNLRGNQGFYVYRNGRLIVWGTWFKRGRKSSLSQLSRVQIDIPSKYDHEWILDVKKSSATPPKLISTALDAMIDQLAQRSKRTWTYRGKKEIDDKVQHIWNRRKTRNGDYSYEVNLDHPFVARLIERFPDAQNNIKDLIDLINKTLPLTQMHVDFEDENTIVKNNSEFTEDEVNEMVERAQEKVPKGKRKGFLKSLQYTEPFQSFPEILERFMK